MLSASVVWLLVRIASDQEVLEQVAHKLQRHVLKRKRRTVEQLKEVQLLVLVQRDKGRDMLRSERLVAPSHDVLQIAWWYLLLGDVQREDFVGQLLKAQISPFRLPV